ncbi:hypothetical protein GOODEAATRI_024331 [Goodea atripinnis]|uniref:BED-type domain-containing protein n=1 Tax=Goodea atripinnis TaxID=208336 RepID=A0ABV0N415_9TELE
MPDMNTAFHAQERNKCDPNYARYNICDTKYKAITGNTSNLRKHLVKHKIFIKAEECTIFKSLRSTAAAPAFSAVSAPASTCDTSAGNNDDASEAAASASLSAPGK